MNYMAKVYRGIAIIVLAVGLAVIPALQYLIAEDISTLPFTLNNLRIYYLFFLANTVGSYLLAYKRTIITADQNSYIVSAVDNFGSVALYIVQTVLLLVFKNYYAYLATMVLKTVVNNVILTLIANKKYPYLKTYRREKLEKEYRRDIFKYVRANFLHKIGSVVIYSTTSLIISAFVSIVEAGMYSNYLLIAQGISMFVNMVFNSITASIGDLCVGDDKERQYTVFRRLAYLGNFLGIFVFICYVCLFNDFIPLWIGENMVFPMHTVAAISLSSMVSILRKSADAFRNAQGIFKLDWYKPILEATIGIALAIGLSFVWGTFGVIIGYTLSSVFVAVPIENYVLFKHGLKRSMLGHTLRMLGSALFAFAAGAFTYSICTFFPSGAGWFILELAFCIVFATALFVLFTFRSPEFKYYVTLPRRLFKKIFKRHKKKEESL